MYDHVCNEKYKIKSLKILNIFIYMKLICSPFYHVVNGQPYILVFFIFLEQFSNEILLAHKVYKTFYRRRKKLQGDDAIQGVTLLAKKGGYNF